MSEYIEIHSTTDSREEADKIIAAALEAKLVACGQVLGPMRSTYWWKGDLEQADEYFLMMKTTSDLFDEVAKTIKENHSYEVADIVAVPLRNGARDYLDWISAETRASDGSA